MSKTTIWILTCVGVAALVVLLFVALPKISKDNDDPTCESYLETETSGKVEDVLVLIDVPDNGAESASQIARDVSSQLNTIVVAEKQVRITGLVYGGEGSPARIRCMDEATYSFTGNSKRQSEHAEVVRTDIEEAVKASVRGTAVGDSGDFRALFRQGSPDTADADQVLLWSSMVSNGSDCLDLDSEKDTPVSEKFAKAVVKRCADANLLPTATPASVRVLGAGYSPDDPNLVAWGEYFADAVCPQLSSKCEVD